MKISRLETGAIRLEKKDAPLIDTLAFGCGGIVYAAEKKDICVTVDCPEDLCLSHDSKWTAEAVFNLLDNAVKYTPAGGTIRPLFSGASIVRKKYTNSRAWALACIWPARS